jgi:hypothetical protein
MLQTCMKSTTKQHKPWSPICCHAVHHVDCGALQVIALSSRPDLASIASRADVAVQLGGLLETFRGATRATLSRTQPPLFALVSRLLQPLLTLQHAFRAHTGTVALVLKLAAEVVEYHVSYLRVSQGVQ